ncbi:MAG: aminoacyl-tRNA hydrolase [Syntrophomonadaceae bacterium]|nr:aminoacyl-tRNA hydrolase [Syntrophomonadaceae bacterium]
MKLIVGLGNPGQEYKNTRHNMGFMVVEELARELRVIKQKYVHNGVIAWTQFHGETVLIAKPLTFMNLSGKAVQPMVRAYHITLPELMVVVDDLDLDLGVIRLRARGGSGGHKGLQSIIDCLGTQDFPRLRLGIGRPPDEEVIDWVLTRFSQDEETLVKEAVDRAVKALKLWLVSGIEKAMNQYNRS